MYFKLSSPTVDGIYYGWSEHNSLDKLLFEMKIKYKRWQLGYSESLLYFGILEHSDFKLEYFSVEERDVRHIKLIKKGFLEFYLPTDKEYSEMMKNEPRHIYDECNFKKNIVDV